MVPLLKYVRGEVLSTDHWHELFRMLNMPKGTTLERLQFSDILRHSGAIVESSNALKDLFSRAQGEVSIREALKELELWGAATEFTLSEFEDSQGTKLTVIREWKEIINQVSGRVCWMSDWGVGATDG